MSTLRRKIFLCAIGAITGLALWPIAETILLYQHKFPSYLTFSIFLGMVFGLVFGGFFGASDKIIISSKTRVFSAVLQGSLIGIAGGVVGFFIGQGVLFLIGENFIQSTKNFNLIGFPISRAIGWSVLGIFIGMVDGIRSRSSNKIKIGIAGGFLGGFVGGLSLEYLRFVVPNIMYARLIGLIIYGVSIGFFYGMVEKRLSYGLLILLNGKDKGMEFLINQRKMTIGSSLNNNIVLHDYSEINETHADIFIKDLKVFIKEHGVDSSVLVNEMSVNKLELHYGDMIKLGSANIKYKLS